MQHAVPDRASSHASTPRSTSCNMQLLLDCGPASIWPDSIISPRAACISRQSPALFENTSSASSRRCPVSAACMDRRRDGQRLPDERNNTSSRRPFSRQQTSNRNERPASCISPVSPPQWDHVPLPYRPRDWSQQQQAAVQGHWRIRSEQPPSTGNWQLHRPESQRNRPERLTIRNEVRPMDVSLLYPPLNPYADNSSSLSAPEELQYVPRSVSQPNTPSLVQGTRQGVWNEPSFSMLPRAPTYPPANRRRGVSASNLPDTTFTDEEEFRLFVQATAGLGPEQALRASQSPSDSPRYVDTNTRGNAQGLAHTGSEQLISPLAETPTTMLALHQLASMPQGSNALQYRRTEPSARPWSQIDVATAGVDLWLNSTAANTYNDGDDGNVSPLEDDEDEDELPDYAASQAQAQAAQRVEAARRAQELQRRWQQSRWWE